MSAKGLNAPPISKEGPGSRRIESSAALARIRQDVQDRKMERLLTGKEAAFGYIRKDSEASPEEKRTIKRMERVLKNNAPDSLSEADTRKWESEGKRLEEWLRSKMVPRSGMELRKAHDPNFQKAVRLHASIEMSQEFVNIANRWKNIMRQLHFDEPEMSNLERIRPS